MKKALGIVAILVIYYLIMAYLIGMFSGAISQDAWEQIMAGKSPKIVIQTDPVAALGSVFHSPAVLRIWLGVATVLLVVAGVFIFAYRDELKIHFGKEVPADERNTYGSADWMKQSEAKKVFKFGSEQKGILLGKVKGQRVVLPADTKYNKHIAIFGAPGTGKSRTFARPNIVQIAKMGQSMIVTDPKGELFEDMSVWLEKQGYDVKALNLVNIECSDRWNPLDAVADDMDATVFADVVIRNTQAGMRKAGGDPFWDRAELNLLKALVLYIKETRPAQGQNLGELYRLLATTNMAGLQSMFMNIPNDRASKMAYNIFAQASEQVRTGVIIGLGTRLQVFQNRLVQKMTEVSDIDLEAPKRRKVAYFCIISDTHRAFSFLSSLFFSFLFIKLVNLHDTTTDPEIRAREVYFLLDEFPNIGEIPDFQEKIATIRSRRLHCSIIFQSLGQLEKIYPLDWENIIGCCDTKFFLGANDLKTAEYVSELLGTKSIHTRSVSRQGGLEGLTEIERITQSVGKRQLLTQDEVLRFENEKAIVMVRGHKPLIVEKVDISELKESKQLTIRAIKDYLRPWAAEVTGNTTAGQVCDAGAQSQINADQSQNRFTTPPENNADGSEGNEQKETGEDELL
ncbi:type IV secretion system protein VirD4 [Caldicellulosiruptor bescii]|uniref:TRAG family protein n=2 Tax=Caldicellulosiruptor bescii TaxID=31899 RepID=B9MP28_CALBD|nr:type IV secretory system conjugative DNA transfer family protein [Caldicellulosiruptor bescii]ACM61587.1 TRAG family protein [Caldicellulosiruptor bescii DSM 6725]PBC88604.1 type IV secretion system protein VirD4 [Caldicellulosiruptor bescii]PBC91915.1 type IV secretion system protein VirD4 [Caldicellulosiruptor bescii]PBD02674.1 type IV secretion system protein VirD4 [Caldicellulosiruptor bescii]PBD07710.1 type IV secretion system protein VirD4 [Caldicellulosiruptor bescii]